MATHWHQVGEMNGMIELFLTAEVGARKTQEDKAFCWSLLFDSSWRRPTAEQSLDKMSGHIALVGFFTMDGTLREQQATDH